MDEDCDYEPMVEDELYEHECNELDRDRNAGEFDEPSDDEPCEACLEGECEADHDCPSCGSYTSLPGQYCRSCNHAEGHRERSEMSDQE